MIKDKLEALQSSLALLSDAKDFTLTVEDNEDNKYVLVFCDYGMDKYQSDTITQYKEALRDIIPLAERAMDDIRKLVSERELITKVRQLLTDNTK